MRIADTTVLVTGAKRGIGEALVQEALRRGATRVYAGTRQALDHLDARVTPLTLDLTDAAQIRAAVDSVGSLDLLINNAGLALYDDLRDRAALERHLAVNLFGTYDVTQAFLPLLEESQGAIVNILSVAALAALPVIPAYSVSKAAAFNMSRDLEIPKSSSRSVAHGIFDGVENGEDEIFPDAMSESIAESWRNGAAKALERANAALVQAEPVAS